MNMAGKSRSIFLTLLVLALFFSCTNKNSLTYKIANYLENECQFDADTCEINLDNIIDFDWDIMYTFAEMNPPEGVSNIIGFEYFGKGTNWGTQLFVFIKDNKVVYEEIRAEWEGSFYFYSKTLGPFIEKKPFYHNQPFYVRRIKEDNGKYFYEIYQYYKGDVAD